MQVELVQQLFEQPRLGLPVEIAPQFEDGAQIVFSGKFAEYAGFLGQVTDAGLGALMHGRRGQIRSSSEIAPPSALSKPTIM